MQLFFSYFLVTFVNGRLLCFRVQISVLLLQIKLKSCPKHKVLHFFLVQHEGGMNHALDVSMSLSLSLLNQGGNFVDEIKLKTSVLDGCNLKSPISVFLSVTT